MGTGNYSGCREALMSLLLRNKQDEIRENFLECSEDSLYELPINFTLMPFYGFSEFWYTMNDVLSLGGAYKKTQFDDYAAVSVFVWC